LSSRAVRPYLAAVNVPMLLRSRAAERSLREPGTTSETSERESGGADRELDGAAEDAY
jgi:hypothetical protein